MAWWTRFLERLQARDEAVAPATPLPGEPEVYECLACGKLFERSKGRAPCPECDSPEVERLG